MKKAIDLCFKAMEAVMVALLASMVAMVFLNVVLRYAFDDGIDVSDELSRYFFVWLTFLGAVVVHRENAHLGVETLVSVLPDLGKRTCMFLSDSLVLVCCAIFFWGTVKMQGINASNVAPITGISMSYVYGIGYFTALGIGAMTALRIVRLATGTLAEGELAAFAGGHDGDAAHSIKERLE